MQDPNARKRGGIAPFEIRVCVHPLPQRVRLTVVVPAEPSALGGA